MILLWEVQTKEASATPRVKKTGSRQMDSRAKGLK